MEIGSAYALQVCLLQIPAMVAFSAWYDPNKMGAAADTFTYVVFTCAWTTLCCTYIWRADLQTYIPALGCYCNYPLYLLDDIYLHRGQEQLPQRKHTDLKVHPTQIIRNTLLIVRCSYIVLVSGFYFAPRLSEDIESAIVSLLGQ